MQITFWAHARARTFKSSLLMPTDSRPPYTRGGRTLLSSSRSREGGGWRRLQSSPPQPPLADAATELLCARAPAAAQPLLLILLRRCRTSFSRHGGVSFLSFFSFSPGVLSGQPNPVKLTAVAAESGYLRPGATDSLPPPLAPPHHGGV